MFTSLAILLGLLAYASSDCVMGPWGEWGQCRSRDTCMKIPAKDRSFPAPPSPEHGEAHQRMLESMEAKERARMARGDCRRDGTCVARPSSGPAPCVDGSADDYWYCHNMDLEYHISIEDLGYDDSVTGDWNPEGNDVWAWVDPSDQEEYVLMGTTGCTSFVRVTHPQAPEVLGVMYSTDNVATIWRDIKTKGNFAYVISEASHHGMQVFDLTRLRGLSANNTRIFLPDTTYFGIGRSHNIVGNDDSNYMYIVGARNEAFQYPDNCGGGLHIVDVTDPLNPTFAACFWDDGYSHDADCVIYDGPDTRYTGQEICFGYNEDSITIVDVTDKENMILLGRQEYLHSHYTHQGWLSEDKSIAFMDDELDEQRGPVPNTRTLIWAVDDLEFPFLMNSYYSLYEAADHNLYVLGDYVYQSNYKAGLQMLRIDADNYDLNWVAEFDVHPYGTDTEFGGSWSNYPFLPSGTLVVSSFEEGLFLLKIDWDGINNEATKTTGFQERFREVQDSDVKTCSKTSQKRPCEGAPSC